MASKRKILLADDHALFRRGLRELLLEEFKGAVIGEASSAQETLEQIWKNEWDVVLLDLSMPGRSGLELLTEIKKERPKIPVLVLSAHPEEQYGFQVLQCGAAGYITKSRTPREMVEAVRTVLAGEPYITATLAAKMAANLFRPSEGEGHERLSPRELQILERLGAGKTVKEIASELSLSVATISTYRTRLLQKMGMETTAQLIRYAVDHKLSE